MDNWLNVQIVGTAIWPKHELMIVFGDQEIVLRPATRTTEQSAHINLKAVSTRDALTLINRFLSVLCWCDDQPMEIRYSWSGSAVPVSVPKDNRQTGTSIGFPFYRQASTDPRVALALALFREGRSISSIPFEFLSYFKILNIFWKDKFTTSANGRTNPLVEGIRQSLPLIGDKSIRSRISVLSASASDVAAYLYESGRCAIAHAHTQPVVDPDNLKDLDRLAHDMPIVKAIAVYLIEVELGVSRSIVG